jgi:4-hydroxy-3-methylbut-2-enyl diphosphate reductase
MPDKAKRHILLCAPRGFCAGVERAVLIVEEALRRFGAPVYVRHEIVHNRYVVESLKAKGAIFVKELDEIPPTRQPVVFSAHGVPKSVPENAAAREMFFLDAICPLVSKVHKEAILHHRRGREIVLVGHAGHPEVEGTMGQLPPGAISLIESVEDARSFQPRDPENLAWVTRHMSSTKRRSRRVRGAFPAIVGPHKGTSATRHEPQEGGEAGRAAVD